MTAPATPGLSIILRHYDDRKIYLVADLDGFLELFHLLVELALDVVICQHLDQKGEDERWIVEQEKDGGRCTEL